jgi:hypothetical protein
MLVGCVTIPLAIVRFMIRQKTVNRLRSWLSVGDTSKRCARECQSDTLAKIGDAKN